MFFNTFLLACQVTITRFVFSLPNADCICRVSVSFGNTGSTIEKKTEMNKVLQLATLYKNQEKLKSLGLFDQKWQKLFEILKFFASSEWDDFCRISYVNTHKNHGHDAEFKWSKNNKQHLVPSWSKMTNIRN